MVRVRLKKYIALLLAIVLLAAPLAGCGASALPEGSVELVSSVSDVVPQSLASVAPVQGMSPPAAIRDIFPDEVLASEVARQLRTTIEAIVTQADLDQVQRLSLFHTDAAANLEGVQYLREIAEIIVRNSDISDLSSLSGLGYLWRLELSGSQISDLTPLSGLFNLEFLNLIGNQISDLDPLSGLLNLEFLYLGENQINDLDPLSGLVNLQALGLGNNQISDIKPLSELANLRLLELVHNQITDFSPISDEVSFIGGMMFGAGLFGTGQEATLEPILRTETVSITNMVRDRHGNPIPPNYISDGGIYENGTITWDRLTTQEVISFSWYYGIWYTHIHFEYISGTVTIPLMPDPTTARTVVFQLDGIDTPVTAFPNWRIDWNQSPEAQEIYNTDHMLSTGCWFEMTLVQGQAFWGWFRSDDLVHDRGGPISRPALGATGENLSTLTFTENELDEDIIFVAVWSLWGDVNDDGWVCSADVLLINQWLFDQTTYAPPHFNAQLNLHAADVNVDGVVNSADTLALNQWLFDRTLPGPPNFDVVLGRPMP